MCFSSYTERHALVLLVYQTVISYQAGQLLPIIRLPKLPTRRQSTIRGAHNDRALRQSPERRHVLYIRRHNTSGRF